MLVAPVSRLALVLGKLTGGTVLALIQAMLFLTLGPLLHFVGLAPAIGWQLSAVGWLAMIGFLTLVAFALTALGFLMAWSMDSTQGFHALMSVFLMPMWLLSGSFFPPGESGWLTWVIWLNPLTYGVAGLRRIMSTNPAAVEALPAWWLCLSVTVLAAACYVGAAIWMTGRRSAHNAR